MFFDDNGSVIKGDCLVGKKAFQCECGKYVIMCRTGTDL